MGVGHPGGSVGRESAYSAGDPGLISGSGRSPGGVNDCPLQDSCPENSIMLVPYQYKVSITFTCAWKPRNSYDLFIGIVALLQRSETQPAGLLRSACTPECVVIVVV